MTLSASKPNFSLVIKATILAKSPGALCKFKISQHSPALPPNTNLVFGRSTRGNGEMFLYNNAMYLRNRSFGVDGGCVESTIIEMLRMV